MRVLSPGKLRGMEQIASARGVIAVTAIDHRGSLEAMLKRALPGGRSASAEMAEEKLRIARALAPLSTAVLLDPLHGVTSCPTARSRAPSGSSCASRSSGTRAQPRGA